MEVAPLPMDMVPKEEIKESFEIKQEEKNYKLNIEIINQEIKLNIYDENDLMKEYEIKIPYYELREMHTIFLTFSSCQDFIDFIKATIENKKILIKKNKEDQITIELMVEYLFKQNIIKFDLNLKKINYGSMTPDLCQKIAHLEQAYKKLEMNYKELNDENCKIKEKIKIIEEENKKLKNRIDNLEMNDLPDKELIYFEKENTSKPIDSSIIEPNEFNMIYSAIKEQTNKEIKGIKKIFQATKNCGDATSFHKFCDGIPNTIVVFQTAGNRRFGGFASECWKTGLGSIPNKYSFLFSLDKKKIYYPQNYNIESIINSDDGPCFSAGQAYIFKSYKNPLKLPNLKTNECRHKDIFDGDENALSEDGKFVGIYAKEYEVFQIIFK